jgi:hypothetical protein
MHMKKFLFGVAAVSALFIPTALQARTPKLQAVKIVKDVPTQFFGGGGFGGGFGGGGGFFGGRFGGGGGGFGGGFFGGRFRRQPPIVINNFGGFGFRAQPIFFGGGFRTFPSCGCGFGGFQTLPSFDPSFQFQQQSFQLPSFDQSFQFQQQVFPVQSFQSFQSFPIFQSRSSFFGGSFCQPRFFAQPFGRSFF